MFLSNRSLRSLAVILASLVFLAAGLTIAQESAPASQATTRATSNPAFAPWDHNSVQPAPAIPANKLPPVTTQPGDGQTEAVYRAAIAWFDKAIEDADKLVPAAEMTASGILDGGHIYATGSRGLAQELYGRAGGFSYAILTEYQQEKLNKNDTLLMMMPTPRDENPIESDLPTLSYGGGWRIPGTVVHIAGHDWTYLKRIMPYVNKEAWQGRLHLIDDHSPEGGSWANVSLRQMAAAATAWAFCGEVFAAASRKGKTLATLGSDVEPNGPAWDKSCETLHVNERFTVAPIPPGQTARKYYRICQKQIIDFLESGQASQVRVAAQRLDETFDRGNACLVLIRGHIHPRASIIPRELPGMVIIGRPWEWRPRKQQLQSGDMLLHVGYLAYPRQDVYDAIAAGANVITMASATGPTDERRTHIQETWTDWDSVVDVDGLPVRILPSSGVVQTPLWYALMAETIQAQKKP